MLPQVGGQILITLAFKFALEADLNAGCITSVFCTMYSVYISVLFYYCFKQVISGSKMTGMVLIIICIVFLTFDKKVDEAGETGLSAKQKRLNGGIAIACALGAPMIWCIKMYFMRKAIDGNYYGSTADMALDS